MSTRKTASSWRDPDRPRSGPDLDSDRFGLALVIARAFAQAKVTIHGGHARVPLILKSPFDHSTFKAALAHGLGPRPHRLSPSNWKRVLESLPI
jgi:hypothetical protein